MEDFTRNLEFKGTIMNFKIESNKFSGKKLCGKSPTVEEFLLFLKKFFYEYEKNGSIKKEKEDKYIRIISRQGMSGSVDFYIEKTTDLNEIWPERRHLVHFSCYGNMNQDISNVEAIDIIRWLVSYGVLLENQKFFYTSICEYEEGLLEDIAIKKPRKLKEEFGWTPPEITTRLKILDIYDEGVIVR